MALRRPYEVVSLIPLVLWTAGHAYVSSFDGWGGWAAAPILLVPLAVSLVVGIVINAAYLRLPRSERQSPRSIIVLILPWIPIFHVLAGNVWRSMTG